MDYELDYYEPSAELLRSHDFYSIPDEDGEDDETLWRQTQLRLSAFNNGINKWEWEIFIYGGRLTVYLDKLDSIGETEVEQQEYPGPDSDDERSVFQGRLRSDADFNLMLWMVGFYDEQPA